MKLNIQLKRHCIFGIYYQQCNTFFNQKLCKRNYKNVTHNHKNTYKDNTKCVILKMTMNAQYVKSIIFVFNISTYSNTFMCSLYFCIKNNAE